MKANQSSLQQQAKQSLSINIHQARYDDYIDQKFKQNQITLFMTLPHIYKKTQLKQLNSNQQNKRMTSLLDKSTLESGEIKLCRQRIQTLQARLKQKNTQLKCKQDEISRLKMLNQQLQNFKLQFLLESSSFTVTLSTQTKQIQTDPFAIDSQSLDYLAKSSLQEQVIELRFQLQKYKKKYLIIEQSLKKRACDYQHQLSSLARKLKQEKMQNSTLQQSIFTLQQQNIDLKQKLEQAYEEIQSLQLQKNLSREIPLSIDFKNLQNNERRFSFGNDLKQIGSSSQIRQSKPLFLNIFNEVSYSYAPQIHRQTGRFKPETQKKTNTYLIRLYPRMYEIKIIGNTHQNRLFQMQQDNRPKFMSIGSNTVRKNLQFKASLNIKISNLSENDCKIVKSKKNFKICPKQVSFNHDSYQRSKIVHKQNYSQIQSPYTNRINPSLNPFDFNDRKTLNIPVDSIDVQYKISSMNDLKNIQKTNISSQYDKAIHQRKGFDYMEKTQIVDLNKTTKYHKLDISQSGTHSLSSNKDILQKINHHLQKSPILSPKIQKIQKMPLKHQYDQTNIIPSHQNREKFKINKTNEFSDWIVDDIHQEKNRILSRYTSGKINEITYRQNFTLNPLPVSSHQRKTDFTISTSNSVHDFKNDKCLIRNMSLTSLERVKTRESITKNTPFRRNQTQSRQLLNLDKTQQIKDSRMNVPLTPSRQSTSKINPSVSMKDLIAQKCKKLSIY